MDANLTVQDLFRLILYLIGIGVGTYFILVLSKINRILGQARDIIDSNLNELETTIKQLPDISYNVNEITREAKDALNQLTPEITGLVQNVNCISQQAASITNTVKDTTERVSDTVDEVAESIADTAIAFKYGTKTITDYIHLILEVFELIKNKLKK
ncbi:MAG: hypothetical protein GX185_02025 [Tissierellia bacterium]|nr:hypothetical protein [Tissierellia bacterium]